MQEFFPSTESEGAADRPVGTAAPVDAVQGIISSTTLDSTQKRAVLASWASDARAVQDTPSLRRLDDGTLIEIDAILDGLRRLDDLPPPAPLASARRKPLDRRAKLIRFWRARRRDDDDDPTTAPAVMHPIRPAPLADAARLQPAA